MNLGQIQRQGAEQTREQMASPGGSRRKLRIPSCSVPLIDGPGSFRAFSRHSGTTVTDAFETSGFHEAVQSITIFWNDLRGTGNRVDQKTGI